VILDCIIQCLNILYVYNMRKRTLLFKYSDINIDFSVAVNHVN